MVRGLQRQSPVFSRPYPTCSPRTSRTDSKTRTVIKDGQIISTDALKGAADLPLDVPVA
jgi:hypothetical protein